jgi:acyl-CoA synthetase (AMP-forming)/AMP-acid ligase II
MFIVRGENIYPSAIEDTLRGIDGFGGEFRVIVSRTEAMDELLVRAEYAVSHAAPERREALRAVMREPCARASACIRRSSWCRKARSRAWSSRRAGSSTTVICTGEPTMFNPKEVELARRLQRQVARTRDVRRRRDGTALLDQLAREALEAVNLMPTTIDLVKARATMGEITARLREVWGRYVERPRILRRIASVSV